MTTTSYTYSMGHTHRDQYGIPRTAGLVEITEDELAELTLGEFQGASDLPDETAFAVGTDAAGRDVMVYRSEN